MRKIGWFDKMFVADSWADVREMNAINDATDHIGNPQRRPWQRCPQPRVLPLLLLQSPASRGLLPEAARQNSV